MRRTSVLLIALVIFGGAITSAVLVHVMTEGESACPCVGPMQGKLLKFHISDDIRTVKFVISLEFPRRVERWSSIKISLNLSGKLFNLKFNSTAGVWRLGNYTPLRSTTGTGTAWWDTGDYLIVHSKILGFRKGYSVRLEVVGYPGYLSADLG